MKIVICDDDAAELNKLSTALKNIFTEHVLPLEIVSFNNGKDCYSYLLNNTADIVFFDIYLQDSLGIDLALKLRDAGCTFKLIFLTTSNEFANESYEARASYYLLKPATPEQLEKSLTFCDAFAEEATITLDAGRSGQLTINPEKIIAVEVKDKYCFIYTTTQTYKQYSSMNKIREQLSQNYFLQIHRSYLINMNYVQDVQTSCFVMTNGFKAPIRVRDANAIRNYYMQWSLDNM